jgi:RNA polymerase sigma-70 factor (ECF subfamily)
MQGKPDFDLVEECLGGDNAAFRELIRRYQDRLYRTVLRLVGNMADALDVVQETFLKAYGSLANFQEDTEFFTWLYRIAFNAAISQRRQRRPNPGL